MELKRCSNCYQMLPTSNFHFNHARKNCLQSWCKTCKSVAGKKARLERKTPERLRVMSKWGETCSGSKLTNQDVVLIRGLFDWLSCAEIARKFDVHRTTISAIKNGRTWYRLR